MFEIREKLHANLVESFRRLIFEVEDTVNNNSVAAYSSFGELTKLVHEFE